LVSPRGFLVVIAVLAVLMVGPWLFFRAEGGPPLLVTPPEIVTGPTGGSFTIGFADDGAGLKGIRVSLVHAGGETMLVQETLPGELLMGGVTATHEVEVKLDAELIAGLKGDPKLRIAATDWSLLANLSQRELPIEIDRVPPRVEATSGLTYVKHGGSGAVAYTVSDDSARDGVLVGEVFFQGYPKPGSAPGERVAIFAIPADAARNPEIVVMAEDAVGNRATGTWAVVPQYRAQPKDDIRLDARFMERILPRFDKPGTGESKAVAQAFDSVNQELRAANEQTIRSELTLSDDTLTLGTRLSQMTNSQVTSRFGELRSYFFEGKQISSATHYGYDLASTSKAPITAAGGGRVAFAGDLGIYGNCVLIDHGMGLATLYGHLTRIDVKPGARVEQEQTLGISGATGLAGGDHLHFAVLVGEIYVDPIEWWDAKWVASHIAVALK
jgi:murein DD-endopeptidase MepM/ murein hydrolase activator NlpD